MCFTHFTCQLQVRLQADLQVLLMMLLTAGC